MDADFFVSYTQADQAWAVWIAWELEEDGYRVLVQAWDLVPGTNWIASMQDGTRKAARTVAVLSKAYLESLYGGAEWQAAWAADPDGRDRKLLAVRVEDCDRPGLLAGVTGFDLVGLDETTARDRLLSRVRAAESGRAKPETRPPFPGDRAVSRAPRFPGAGLLALDVPPHSPKSALAWQHGNPARKWVASDNESVRRKNHSRILWVSAAGLAALVATAWLLYIAGLHATTAGHPSSSQRGSTTSTAHRFYAVANFSQDKKCARPCWLPLYQLPTHESAAVTDGWPCEYYLQSSSPSGPYCLQPPAGRTAIETAEPAKKNSGDRLLILCQVTSISNRQAAQAISNDAGQTSDIWDMIAIPAARILDANVAESALTQVPGMLGSYEAYGPDIWLGDTGWHNIPCR